ncbi:MAG TPA: hypothetical protein VEY67_06100 [Candidatus Dormibacteraeota bacterium]|nr:hypothetical protein [Candidatus Dormibacteraeota bacterium]
MGLRCSADGGEQMAGAGRFAVRIRLRGELGPALASMFGDLTATESGDGTTLLEGSAVDQAAVHGFLDRIRDLGLALVAVETVAVPTQASRNGER